MSRDFNNSQKTFMWNRQKGKCGCCGDDLTEEVDIEYHHILNYKDGGASIVENGVMLCEKCHLHCHNYDFKKSVLIFRTEFEYANWDENQFYRGRKKGKEVAFTKKTLDRFDTQYEGAKMQQDNYENHIRMLENFKQNLLALKRHTLVIRDKYKKQIDVMESAGFVENIITPLRNRYQIFSSKIDEIDRQLEQHNQKIETTKEALNSLIARARMN